jgi:hypothetical protein
MTTALTTQDATLPLVARKPLDIRLDQPNAANIFTTLDIQNDRDKATLVRAMAQPDERVEALIGMEISIVGLVVQTVALVDEKTGEEVEAPRVALLLEDGTTAGATSVGVLNSCKTLTALYGLPSQDRPWLVTVRQVPTRKGYRTFELLPVVPADKAAKPSRRK